MKADTDGYFSEILLGALFLLIVLFVPRGLVPTIGEWTRRLRTRGRPASGTVRPTPAPATPAPPPAPPSGAPPGVLPEAGRKAPSTEAPAGEAKRR